MEIGCASLVRLDLPESRAPQAALDAIYFINPTPKNLELICNDFEILERRIDNLGCYCGDQNVTLVQVKAFMCVRACVLTTTQCELVSVVYVWSVVGTL